ncbi:transposase [Ruegeria spongiae]
MVRNWRSPRRKTRGGQSRYSNSAIETCLTLRVVFRLPLRQPADHR